MTDLVPGAAPHGADRSSTRPPARFSRLEFDGDLVGLGDPGADGQLEAYRHEVVWRFMDSLQHIRLRNQLGNGGQAP